MRIEIWADLVCPWAYVGKRRLEQALAGLGYETDVVWRPFRLDPTAPSRAVPLAEALRDPMADDVLRACAPGLTPAENRVRVSRIAAAEGLGPPWGAAWRTSSHDAHRLLALAHEREGAAAQDAVAEALLRAHFVDALNISDHSVLAAVTEHVLPGVPALLAGDAGEELVRELLLQGRARGVRTSPTIVVGDRAIAGAQPPEVIRDFLHQNERDRDERHRGERVPAEVERFRWAESLLEQRDPLGALTLLRPLLTEHGADRGVRTLAARAYFASAQLGRARAALEDLAARYPDDAYVRVLLGRTLQRQGRDADSLPHLRMGAAMAPELA